MTIALVDNGSLEPAAHRNLRTLASTLSVRTGTTVHAVSWKHSDRLAADSLDGSPGLTIRPWLRAEFHRGERDFLFVPYFISAQGAIGSALRRELEELKVELGGFRFNFADGLAVRGVLPQIVADGIREVIDARQLIRPAVIVVDHGGPAAASALLRDQVAIRVRSALGPAIGPLAAASLEGADYPHNHPLLEEQLTRSGFSSGDVVIAPLFLAPGRHAGTRGDLAQIARAAEDRLGSAGLRSHFTKLIGTHPLVAETLSASLCDALAAFPTLVHELHA